MVTRGLVAKPNAGSILRSARMMSVASLFGVALAASTFAQDVAPRPAAALRGATFSPQENAGTSPLRNRFNPPRYSEARRAAQEPAAVASTHDEFPEDIWQHW